MGMCPCFLKTYFIEVKHWAIFPFGNYLFDMHNKKTYYSRTGNYSLEKRYEQNFFTERE